MVMDESTAAMVKVGMIMIVEKMRHQDLVRRVGVLMMVEVGP